MKKIISLLIIYFIGIISLTAQTFSANGIVYKVTSAAEPYTVELTAVEPSCPDSIIIPAKVDYNGNIYLITSIGEKAFYDNDGLFSIILPNSVRFIGEKAFWGCSNLKYISLPNSLNSISYETFYLCKSLETIDTTEFSYFNWHAGLFGLLRIRFDNNTKFSHRNWWSCIR